ncbi:hypothetical protein [Chitinophaga sp.]|uniref:hypothetical protein n=1 Tax=Chitinophaga sp. TaxID=1869181 RepID=UPI0031DBDA72
MSLFIKRLCILLALAMIVQVGVYFAFKTLLDHRSQFRLSRYFRQPRHQHYILGNSRAVNAVNEQYATQSKHTDLINLGFNGMNYQTISALISDINTKQTNATLFIEITGLLEEKQDDSYAYYMGNSPFLREQYKNTKYAYLHLMRLNNEIFLRNIYYLKKSDADWINKYTISENIIEETRKLAPNDTTMANRPLLIKRMRNIVENCNQYNNKAIFFLAPYYPEYLKKLSQYPPLIDTIQQLHVFDFHDLNTLKIPTTGFSDRIHTNISSSLQITEYLLRL